jgi:hypothetical protein
VPELSVAVDESVENNVDKGEEEVVMHVKTDGVSTIMDEVDDTFALFKNFCNFN